ncbi:RagB/SusD family nutrient uptake outer membrane protein [uncultured Algibacter sp.]|uniref:RagB/SusD family nutrient uptake outer membrane protein n=1 Tax=uncultured Algibacter sp. TaxID=298659 RepID=UPI00262217D2|nr:RagB/SusD family nutrient uptake outer membrane protein [uncultured Algibacter sp.]
MKNIKYNILKVAFLFLLISSCDEVLDETPDNRTTIDSPEKIAELLVGAYPEAAYVPFLEPMSDNAGDKGFSQTSEFRVNQLMYFWEDINDIDEDTPTNYWNEAYEAIAQANQALASIEELGGGDELNSLKGEALLCRAYAHFMLVTIFCKPYNPTTAGSDLGITYITKPETVLLGDYSRGTIANVYENIKRDLEEGINLIEDDYSVPTFHFTKRAASAFASRFYLVTANWDKVIEHSNKVLGSSNEINELRNIANITGSGLTFQQQVGLYTNSTLESANLLLVSCASIYNRMEGVAQYQLSQNLVNTIFSANITGKSWAYNIFTRGGGENNLTPKYQEYFKVTNQAVGIGIPFVTFVLLSTDEVLLNRAEAYAMKGELQKATDDINISLQVKTTNYNSLTDLLSINTINNFYQGLTGTEYTPYYNIPSPSLPLVAAVLDIKRTVFYNEGLRWFDVKRHNIEINHRDIFGNSYKLPKDDLRRVIQIPEAAQSFGIAENPR